MEFGRVGESLVLFNKYFLIFFSVLGFLFVGVEMFWKCRGRRVRVGYI